MSELRETPLDPRSAIRQELHSLDPSLELLAEDILGGETRIDLLAVDSARRPVLLLIAGLGEDLACLTRALASRAWVRARARDWCKLSPDLDLRPEVGVRTVVLCPSFHPETIAAAESLGPSVVELAVYRNRRDGGLWKLELKEVSRSEPKPDNGDGAEQVPFRSGLSDDDLNLTARERSSFD